MTRYRPPLEPRAHRHLAEDAPEPPFQTRLTAGAWLRIRDGRSGMPDWDYYTRRAIALCNQW